MFAKFINTRLKLYAVQNNLRIPKTSHLSCSINKLFLKISQHSKGNTCVAVSLFQKTCSCIKNWLNWVNLQSSSEFCQTAKLFLTLPTQSISECFIKIKTNLNFYFHTYLWCLKGLQKTFWNTTKKFESKNLI